MSKYRYTLDLQLFSEDVGAVDSGVDAAPAAEVHTEDSGVETPAAAEPKDSNNFEKAFAKRLAAERAQWESKYSELESKYKDYDTHRELSEFFQQQYGADAMSLKEQIEMQRLQERAEQNNISPEMQRRLEVLEQKAAKADELERQRLEEEQQRTQAQEQEQWAKSVQSGMEEFVKDKGVEADKLAQFMVENELTINPDNMARSFEIALKAMRHDELQAKLESAEKDGMKKLIQAKSSIPKVSASTSQGHVTAPPAKTLAEARARAMARLSGE